MTTPGRTYFFSYARHDSAFVLQLATDLRAAGADLWLDQLDILGGQRWDQAIEKALRVCEGMIVVLSPDAVASHNVMDEVSFALEEGRLIVPVLYRHCDIPFRLRRVQYIDLTGDYHRGLAQLLRALAIEPQRTPAVREAPAHHDPAPAVGTGQVAAPEAGKPAAVPVPGPPRPSGTGATNPPRPAASAAASRRRSGRQWATVAAVFAAFAAAGFGVGNAIWFATDGNPESLPWIGAVLTWLGGLAASYLLWRRFG